MWLLIKSALSPIWGYLAAGGAAIAALWLYGFSKKREGRKEKESEDRQAIAEAQERKRKRDIATRSAPGGDPQRERLREQRDKITELLRSRRTPDS